MQLFVQYFHAQSTYHPTSTHGDYMKMEMGLGSKISNVIIQSCKGYFKPNYFTIKKDFPSIISNEEAEKS